MKPRTDGPAYTDYDEDGVSIINEPEYWVFGIQLTKAQVEENKVAFDAIQRTLDQLDICVGEYGAGRDKWCRFETKTELLEAVKTGELTLVSGPRGQQKLEKIKVHSGGTGAGGFLAAAGVVGLLAMAAKAQMGAKKQVAVQAEISASPGLGQEKTK